MFIDCVPMDADERRYNDNPLDRAMCEAVKTTSVPGVYAVSVGMIISPAQRAGSWLTQGNVIWVVIGTITEQHTTIAEFNALPETAKAAMNEAALRNAMTAIEEVIMLRRQGTATRG